MNILAGACMALGLRYAGSAHAEAAATLTALLLSFLKQKQSASDRKAPFMHPQPAQPALTPKRRPGNTPP